MAPHDGEDDPAVYGSGSKSKKSKSKKAAETETEAEVQNETPSPPISATSLKNILNFRQIRHVAQNDEGIRRSSIDVVAVIERVHSLWDHAHAPGDHSDGSECCASWMRTT